MRNRKLWVAVAVISAACGGSSENGPAAGGSGAGGPGAMPPLPVEMRTVELKPVEKTDEFVGTVKSLRSTTIQPQAEGFLQRILVTSGQRVQPGTPMFEIDSTWHQAALANLESVRAAREADAAFARQQAQRAKGLIGVGAMSQQEYEQALTHQKTAEAQLKAADEQIRQLRTEMGYYRVTSPTAGTVGDIPARVGDRVTKQTMLTTVDDNSGLEVYVNVPVQQGPNLKIGLPLRIVNDTGDTLATSRISFISPSVDESTQTVLVKAPIDSRGGTFRSDQFVRARIVLSLAPGLTVPVVTVTRLNAQMYVFVAEGTDKGLVARQRQITVGPVVGNDYVVTSGLKEGDRLILSGIQMLRDGAPVAPKAAETKSPSGSPQA